MEQHYRCNGNEAKSVDLGDEFFLRRNATEIQHAVRSGA
jgi:hypothetical protein